MWSCVFVFERPACGLGLGFHHQVLLTIHSFYVDVELCNRAVTSRVKGPDGDAAVPLLGRQERCHICHIPYESVLELLLLPRWPVAHLITKDTTSRVTESPVLLKMGWKPKFISPEAFSPQQHGVFFTQPYGRLSTYLPSETQEERSSRHIFLHSVTNLNRPGWNCKKNQKTKQIKTANGSAMSVWTDQDKKLYFPSSLGGAITRKVNWGHEH